MSEHKVYKEKKEKTQSGNFFKHRFHREQLPSSTARKQIGRYTRLKNKREENRRNESKRTGYQNGSVIG